METLAQLQRMNDALWEDLQRYKEQNALLKSAVDMSCHYLSMGNRNREAWSALRAAQQRYSAPHPRPVTKECCELWEAAE